MVESYYNVKNGCKKWPDCFTCPLEDCGIYKKEKCSFGVKLSTEERNKRLRELFDKGYSSYQAANVVGVSRRTAERVRALTKST
jgi:hypothetical protein